MKSPILSINVARDFDPPLSKIFNISLLQGKFLTLWKEVAVVPVFKKRNSALITYYRPIKILKDFLKFFRIQYMINSRFILNVNFTHLSMVLLIKVYCNQTTCLISIIFSVS
jgi:hypothetical protein